MNGIPFELKKIIEYLSHENDEELNEDDEISEYEYAEEEVYEEKEEAFVNEEEEDEGNRTDESILINYFTQFYHPLNFLNLIK